MNDKNIQIDMAAIDAEIAKVQYDGKVKLAAKLGISRIELPDKQCPECVGTGADLEATAKQRARKNIDKKSHVMCRICNGRGADASKFFRWGNHGR